MSKSKDSTSMFASLQGLKKTDEPAKQDVKPVASKEEKIIKHVEEQTEKKVTPAPVVEKKQEEKEEKVKVTEPVRVEKPAKAKDEAQVNKKVPTSVRIDETLREQLLTISLKKSMQEKRRVTISDIIDEALEMYVKKNKDLL